MTVLSVAQKVCRVVGLNEPDQLVASTDRQYIELLSIIDEMALRISRDYNWQKLSKIATFTGDGSTNDFDLPSDYDRMITDGKLWLSRLEAHAQHIQSLDKWLELDVQAFDYVYQAWTIYGDQFHIKPALETAATAKFFYQSNLIIQAADTTLQASFAGDEDVFRLDEQLLKLGTIWQWRESKGLPYAEDMENFEELKSLLIVRDRGTKIITTGQARYNVQVAYPHALGS